MDQNQTLIKKSRNYKTVQEFRENEIYTKVRKVYANKNGQIIGVLLSNNRKYRFADPPTYVRSKGWKVVAQIYVKSRRFDFYDGDLFYFEDYVTNETLSSEIAEWLFNDRMSKNHYCIIL
jgi:hypothetical protein